MICILKYLLLLPLTISGICKSIKMRNVLINFLLTFHGLHGDVRQDVFFFLHLLFAKRCFIKMQRYFAVLNLYSRHETFIVIYSSKFGKGFMQLCEHQMSFQTQIFPCQSSNMISLLCTAWAVRRTVGGTQQVLPLQAACRKLQEEENRRAITLHKEIEQQRLVFFAGSFYSRQTQKAGVISCWIIKLEEMFKQHQDFKWF